VLAPNPGLFTGPGTNTYVARDGGECVVIDPGPVIPEHLAAVRAVLGDDRPVGVLVTHTHPDHAPAANPLAADLGVPAYGFARGPSFNPDVPLADGDGVVFGGARLVAIHTPGHSADHLCYLGGAVLFTGDHVMGGSTVVIEDLTAYLRSLRRVRALDAALFHPGHGPRIDDPGAVVDYYIAHRMEREQQILSALAAGAGTVGEVVEAVYTDVDPALHPVAVHSVAAHLVKLQLEGRVEFGGEAEWEAPVGPVEEAD
jgi:glyoxylase-like metal-dependent hydrolase (beta-lactamase superfamily II)